MLFRFPVPTATLTSKAVLFPTSGAQQKILTLIMLCLLGRYAHMTLFLEWSQAWIIEHFDTSCGRSLRHVPYAASISAATWTCINTTTVTPLDLPPGALWQTSLWLGKTSLTSNSWRACSCVCVCLFVCLLCVFITLIFFLKYLSFSFYIERLSPEVSNRFENAAYFVVSVFERCL